MSDSMVATIVCYPRSGSTYFAQYIQQRTIYYIDKSHKPMLIPGKNLIGVFRDPVECIASFIAKEINFFVEKYGPDKPKNIPGRIRKEIEQYNLMLSFLIDSVDTIVEFNNLISDTEKYVSAVTNILGIEICKTADFVDNLSEIKRDTFVKTSKEFDTYGQLLEMLKEVDLSESYSLFEQAKQKSLIV